MSATPVEPNSSSLSHETELNDPCLIAVWPGMGQVALSAGYYMMAKLGMQQIAEFPAEGLFDVDSVQVHKGVILRPHRPRSRLFGWRDPHGKRDIIMFIGEAQPPLGKYAFCERLLNFATHLGAKRVYTFAAMATAMHPRRDSRVFAAATSSDLIDPLAESGVEVLNEAQIGGLNGVLLGVAADKSFPGVCLLGEMPHLFAPLPFPKASMMVLKTFAELSNLEIDLDELAEQSKEIEQRLGHLVEELQELQAAQQGEVPGSEEESEEEEDFPQPVSDVAEEDEQLIEQLFRGAAHNRSKAYELKRELDRLNLFDRYEDRFLDLFKQG